MKEALLETDQIFLFFLIERLLEFWGDNPLLLSPTPNTSSPKKNYH